MMRNSVIRLIAHWNLKFEFHLLVLETAMYMSSTGPSWNSQLFFVTIPYLIFDDYIILLSRF